MSDLLIRGMEMPTTIGTELYIRFGSDGKTYAIDTNAETTDGEWHEIITVPPHGRLGDLDALAAQCDDPYWCVWLSEIEAAPTIIQASNV